MKVKLLSFVALDLGSSKIAAIAAHIDKKGDTEILSHNLYYSAGVRSGIITDMQAAETSITNAIYALETDCNKNIKSVDISLSGAGTHSSYTSDKINLSDQVITERDVRKLLQKMLANLQSHDRAVIHYFPVEFIIDEKNVVDNPIGMFGKELNCRLHTITADTALLFNITHCLAKCNIEVNSFMLSVYASAIACLSEEEKNLGAIIIDIGANTTSIGIMLSGQLIYCHHLDLGGWHVTYDIAKVFSISTKTAEKFKVLYGDASPSMFDDNSPLRLEDFEPDNQYNPNLVITIGQLASVIHPRIEEILVLVKATLEASAIDHIIAQYVVITGGGAALRSIREIARTIFQRPVRVGKANTIAKFENIHDVAMYTTAIGMVTYHAQKQQKSATNFDSLRTDSWFKRLLASIKANF